MRQYLFLLLLIFPLALFAQLKGEYWCKDVFMYSEWITFQQNQHFLYQNRGCFGGKKGQGVYALDENQLVLYFQSSIDTIPRLTSVIQHTETNKDSVTLSIWLYKWECKDTVNKVKLFVINQKYHILATKDTAENGHILLRFPASEEQVYIYLEHDYREYYLPDSLALNQNYQILLCIPEEEDDSEDYTNYTSSPDDIFPVKEGEIMSFTVKTPIQDTLFLKNNHFEDDFHFFEKQ